MKYAVFGAGGTGGAIGAYLARAGYDVTLIARGAHLDAMRKNGLAVRSRRTGDFTVPVKACAAGDYAEKPDVIFVCVKYYSLDDAAAFIDGCAKDDTVVIPVLNVFGTGGALEERCKKGVFLDGCIYIMSMIEAPGVILQPARIFKVYFGYREGQERKCAQRAEAVRGELEASGIDAFFTGEILKEELKKFSFVSPMGAACLYYGAHGADFKREGREYRLFIALIRETEQLANAMGVTFDEDIVAADKKIMEGLSDEATTSMQRDVMAGRTSEIDGLVHRVARLARERGVTLQNYEMVSRWAMEKGIR